MPFETFHALAMIYLFKGFLNFPAAKSSSSSRFSLTKHFPTSDLGSFPFGLYYAQPPAKVQLQSPFLCDIFPEDPEPQVALLP